MSEPIELLLHEATHARIAAAVTALGGAVRPLLMRDDGSLVRADGTSAVGTAPNAAFGSIDSFLGPAARFVEAMLHAPDFRWLHSSGAGLDFAPFAALAAKGVRISSSSATAPGIGDYVLAAALDHFQRGPDRRRAQAARRWERLAYREIAGTNWLLVGFGAIGQAVAARARAFGARITAVRRSGIAHPLADATIASDRLIAHLPDADVVVLALPIAPATRHLVDARFLAALTPGRTLLVNVARGGHVDEAALLAGLAEGRPDHAALDVFDSEPLPADSPFWDHPRVTLTAHGAPWSDKLVERGDAQFLANLRRFVAGEPLALEATRAEIDAATAASRG